MEALLVKRLDERAILPSKKDENSGYDIYTIETNNIVLRPGESYMFKTGLAVQLPIGYGFIVANRGSVGSKGAVYGAHIIDSGYRGEVFVDIHNISNRPIVFSRETEPEEIKFWENFAGGSTFISLHKAIVQALIVPTMNWPVIEKDELDPSERGTGALGSSGK